MSRMQKKTFYIEIGEVYYCQLCELIIKTKLSGR